MSRSKKNWDQFVDASGNYGLEVKPDGSVVGNFVGAGGAKGEKGQQGGSGVDGDKGEMGGVGPEGDKGVKGDEGDKGEVGDQGQGFAFDDLTDAQKLQITGDKGEKGEKGLDGVNGTPGTHGTDGKSAFELAQDAGFTGTEAEWLASLKGEDGETVKGDKGERGLPGADATSFLRFEGELATAAELASVTDPEFGDVYYIADEQTFYGYNAEDDWVAIGTGDRIKGEKGDEGAGGKSAYELAVDGGFTGSEATWLKGLKGDAGTNGTPGEEGKSAYQSYVDTTADEPPKTEFAWQLSLKGETGPEGGKLTFNDLTPAEKESLKGQKGEKGIQGDQGDEGDEGEKGDKGEVGQTGADGDSAYEIYFDTTADDPKLNDIQWLESLKGEKGEFTPVDQFYTKGESDGRYVKKAGDTISGALNFNGNTDAKTTIKHKGNNRIVLNATGGILYSGTDYVMQWTGGTGMRLFKQLDINGKILTNLKDPVDPKDAVNKQYADGAFLPLSGGTLTDDLNLRTGIKSDRPSSLAPDQWHYLDIQAPEEKTAVRIGAQSKTRAITISESYMGFEHEDIEFRTKDDSDYFFGLFALGNKDSDCEGYYYGKTSEPYHVVNKKYVDEAIDFTKYNELT